MSNLNVEPGTSTLDEMIRLDRRRLLLKTNASWSIDDSRNKFQFGCEWAGASARAGCRGGAQPQLPRHLGHLLALAGDGRRRSTMEVMGTPYCGKGEPNQAIRVGHASRRALRRRRRLRREK